jgi:hypothetical protein
MSKWNWFFDKVGCRPSGQATRQQLDEVEAKTGLPLTAELRDFYMVCNGCQVGDWAQLDSLSTALIAAVDVFPEFQIPSRWGYFPFAGLADVGPWCVCCNEPLRNYVVRLSYDDSDADLQFRDIDSFLSSLATLVTTEKGPFSGIPNDYDESHPMRTVADAGTGLRLVRTAEGMEKSPERGDAFRFAATLLSENEVEELVKLLDKGTRTREIARARLSRMKDPRAAAAIEGSDQEMKDFIQRAIGELRQAGIQVTESPGRSPKVHGAGNVSRYIDLPLWYSKRRSPTVFTDIIQSVHVALKHEKDRLARES